MNADTGTPSEAALPSRWRRWIVPRPSGTGWKSKLRWWTVRLACWYLVIVGAIVVFQRKLIYVPTTSDRLFAADARLPDGNVHDIAIETGDGLTLHGWHFLPGLKVCDSREACDRELSGDAVLVLYFHGNAGNRKTREFDCRPFTTSGCHVFLFDYRGYGDNPGSPSETALTADALRIWKYATGPRGVPPNRIVIFGESLGGGVATELAASLCEAGTPPGGLILEGTFSSLCDAGQYHYPWLPVRWCLFDRYESVARIPAVTCPILQIHGERDRVVPISLARKLFEAAPARSAGGVAKRFVACPHDGHNEISEPKFKRCLREFLESIGGSPPRS